MIIFTLFSWIFLVSDVNSVLIRNISAPSVLESGQDLILDCDFEYQEVEADQLDIKWYFNGSPSPIYQWVPAMEKGPQVIDQLFKNNIDLQYEVHGSNKFTRYRALHITNSDHRFSGTYMCKVSSFIDEDFDQKEVLIYVPPSIIYLDTQKINGDDEQMMNITCSAPAVFPTPSASFTWSHGPTSLLDTHDTTVSTTINKKTLGLVDTSISTIISRKMVEPGQEVIGCEISIPGTDFRRREEKNIFQQAIRTDYLLSSSSEKMRTCLLLLLLPVKLINMI